MSDKEGGKGKELSPDQAKVVVEAVVAEAMKSMGYELGPDGKADFSKVADGDVKAKVPEMMLTLLTNAIQAKKSEQPPQQPVPAPGVVDLDTERKKREPAPPREPSAFERQIQSNLRSAVSDYVSAHVVDEDGPTDVEVDAAFLKDHGPALMTELLGAFVKTLVPEDITLDVPVKDEGKGNKKKKKGEDESQVHMKLDVSGLLRSMMTPREEPSGEE